MNTGRFGRIVSACFVLAFVLAAAAASASGSTNAARHAATVEQVHAVYRGPAPVVAALNAGDAHAAALARADFDTDGAADLAVGYSSNGAGIVTLQRGNPDALAPKGDSIFQRMQHGYDPAWLVAGARAVSVPEPVSFVEAGDFNGDGRPDVLAAALGGRLYLLAGDGHGGLGQAQQVSLPGSVTTLTSGTFGAEDGRPEFAVGVATPAGAELLIYDGGLEHKPLRLSLPGNATALALGGLDADQFQDLAIAAGGRVEIVHGWDPKQSPALASRVERIDGVSGVRGLAIGYFLKDRAGLNEIAASFADGTVRLLVPKGLDTRPLTAKEIQARARARLHTRGTRRHAGSIPAWSSSTATGWALGRTVRAAASSDALPQHLLTMARISLRGTDDLLVADSGRSLDVLRQTDRQGASRTLASSDLALAVADSTAALPLPQKMNGDRGVVVLGDGATAPTIVTVPTVTITVDRADDPSGASLTAASACTVAANDCSLRGAIQFANAAASPPTTITLPDPNTIGGSNHTYVLSIQGSNGCVIEPGATGNTIGDLELNANATINGAGAANTIIRQSGTNDRVLCLNEPLAADIHQTLSGLTITGGRDTQFGGGGIVGGDLNNTLTLDSVVVSNNQTTGHNTPSGGGGIVYTGGSLTITNSTIGGTSDPCSSCTAAQRADPSLGNWGVGVSGGGVEYTPSSPGHTGGTGTFTVTGSTFSHNFATGIGGGGFDVETLAFAAPGGIGSGSASVSTTTFSNNQAPNGGGLEDSTLDTTVATSSFTSNSASNRGGAIYVGGGTLGLTLNGTSPSVTMSGNTATNAGSSISTAYKVTVQGTNVTLGGSIEVTSGGTWTNSAGSVIAPTDVVLANGAFVANDSTTNINGNLQLTTTSASLFNAGTGLFNFNGSGAQAVNGPGSPTFNQLQVNKTGGSTLTLNVNVSVAADLNVGTGTFDLGAFTANRAAAGGTLTVANGATLKIGGTNGMPTNYATHSLGASSTVDYSGTGAQTITAETYGNLTSSSSGARTLPSGQTVAVVGAFTPGSNAWTVAGSTFNYTGSGAQTITAFNYYNLQSFSSGTRTLAPSGTIGVANTFTPGANSYTVTGSTVDFNGTSFQTVPGFNYNNLTISGARGGASVTLVSNPIGVGGTFNPSATAVSYAIGGNTIDFTNNAAQSIPAFNYNNLTNSGGGPRTLASSGTVGIAGSFSPGAGAYTVTGSTVDFNGSGAQTIPAFAYNNLTSSSTGARTLASSGTVGVAGTFTPGSNAYTVTGSTVDFNGSGAQTIPAFNYNNLTSSNTGARTLASSGTVGVAGTFTHGSNGYTVTGSTMDFNGSGAQTVPPATYNNLTVSGSRGGQIVTLSGIIAVAGVLNLSATSVLYADGGSTIQFIGSGPQTIPAFDYDNLTSTNTGARTLASSGTIGVEGTFTPGTNAYTITGSTIDFGNVSAQTIPAFNYNNLSSSNNGARTLSGSIGIAGTFTPGGSSYTVGGSTVNFNGSGAQTIPAFAYNNLTSSSTGTRTLASSGTIGILGTFTPGANVYTVTGSTVEYNGSSAQTLPSAFGIYNNLTLNNAAGTTGFSGLTVQGLLRVKAGTFTSSAGTYRDVQIDNGTTLAGGSSTLLVAGNWTNNGGFTGATSTVVFNGLNTTQTLAGSTTFNNLTINHSGTGNVTAAGSTLVVNGLLAVLAGTFVDSSTLGDVQINSGATFQSDGGTATVGGNWTDNAGAAAGYTAGTGTVSFAKNGTQTLSFPNQTGGIEPFCNLTIGASTILATGDDFATLGAGAGCGTLTNGGQVTHAETATVGTSPVTFRDAFHHATVDFSNEVTGLGSTTVTVAASGAYPASFDNCGSPLPGRVNRYWKLVPTTPNNSTVRLWFRDADERNGQTVAGLKLWKCSGVNWSLVGTNYQTSSSPDASGYDWFQADGVSIGSSYILSGADPTAAAVTSFRARAGAKAVTVTWRTAAEAGLAGFNVWRQRVGTTARVKLNKALLAATHRTKGSTYSYVDRTVRAGVRYTYRLELVGQRGDRRLLAGVTVTARRR
jgi:predicted outer membrane repeat protein